MNQINNSSVAQKAGRKANVSTDTVQILLI